MSTKKRPAITDERKITVDGVEYTLAELQALYDAIGAIPGIRTHERIVEKIVERKPWEQPYVQPLRPYWQEQFPVTRPLPTTIEPMPNMPSIWCVVTGDPAPLPPNVTYTSAGVVGDKMGPCYSSASN